MILADNTKQFTNSEGSQTEEDVIDSVLGGVTLAQAFKRKNFSLIKNVAQRKIQQQVQQIGSQLLAPSPQTSNSGQNVCFYLIVWNGFSLIDYLSHMN